MRKAIRDRIAKWLAEVEEPEICQALPPDSPTPATRMHMHQILNAGVPDSNQSKPARGGFKERYSTRFLSLESPSDFWEPLEGSRDLNPSNNYERKPRRKTRPDRYDYKAQASEIHKKGRREKRTWAKMKRKRTINDDFHASNVPQSRLTLHAGLNTGIFQKGKASRPVRPREAPDLAFSEVKFLSNRPQVSHKESPINALHSKKRQDKRKAHKEPEAKIPDYETRFGEPSPVPRPEQSNRPLPEIIEPRAWHVKRPPAVYPSNSQHGIESIPHDLLPHSKPCSSENPKKRKRSSSSIPYTWSETKQSGSTDLYETCLRILMPVESNIQRNPSWPNSANTYWDSEGLKRLLNSRMELWASENVIPTDGNSAPADERATKRRRRVLQLGKEASVYSRQPSRRTMRDTPVGYAERLGSREVDPVRQSVSAPRSTYSQAYHDMLRRSSAYSGKSGEHDQLDTGVEHHSETLRRPNISHPSHFYNRRTHLSSIDPEAGSSVLESEMRWIEAYYPPQLNRRLPGLNEDEEKFIQSLDDAYNEIIPPDDLQDIAQQHLKEDIYGPERESITEIPIQREWWPPTAWPHRPTKGNDRPPRLLKHGFVDEGHQTINDSPHFIRTPLPERASLPSLQAIPIEPYGFIDEGKSRLIGELPHYVRPPLPEQEPRLSGPYGGIDKRQPRYISESPHFVRPPLPGTLPQIHPGEVIRLRHPRPGIPRELLPTDGKMAGFWRENKLY